VKWPNDVIVGNGKLAGILSEVSTPDMFVVIGIGLNVTLSVEEAGDPVAVSLLDLGPAAPDRNRLTRRLLLELGTRVNDWHAADGLDDKLIADYRARSLTIGSEVRAMLPGDREIVGAARGIDGEGRLIVDSGGKKIAVSAGDIVHLRPVNKSGL
jgi:BirA family biotin operon repressor/biotin-[acetyl-CoA-carboxylase] ligase